MNIKKGASLRPGQGYTGLLWEMGDKDYIKRFVAMQRLPYEVKVRRAEIRVKEFYEKVVYDMEKNVHISVGGLDSLTLLYFFSEPWI